MRSHWIVSLSLVLLNACAGVNIRHVSAGDAKTEGLRFCRPAPFLKVTRTTTSVSKLEEPNPDSSKTEDSNSDAKQRDKWVIKRNDATSTEYDVEVVMLPDPSETYAITWTAGLFGSVAPDVTLKDGWNLEALKADVQSGTASGLEALKGLIPMPGAQAAERTLPEDAGVQQEVFLRALKQAPDGSWHLGPVIQISGDLTRSAQ